MFDKFLPDAPDVGSEGGGPVGGGGGGVSELAGASIEAALKIRIGKLKSIILKGPFKYDVTQIWKNFDPPTLSVTHALGYLLCCREMPHHPPSPVCVTSFINDLLLLQI